MDADLLRQKGTDPHDIQSASVEGLGLRIGQRAALTEAPGHSVHGVLMWLTHADLDELYSAESVRMYKPEAVAVKQRDGTTVPALCYNLIDVPRAEEKNAEYAAKLQQLAGKLGLPPDYVASIAN